MVEVHLVPAVPGGLNVRHIGVPKGFMLTFDNMTVPIRCPIATLKATSRDRYLSYPPVSQGTER